MFPKEWEMTLNMMGCFATSKAEKQRSAGAPRSNVRRNSTVVASRDSLSLLSNKPVVLPDPDHLLGRQSENEHGKSTNTKAPATRTRFENPVVVTRAAFSGPLVGIQSRLQLPSEFVSCSDVEGGKTNDRRILRRAASFGGRPQPLPLPVADVPRKQQLQTVYNLPLPAKPEDVVPQAPGTMAFKRDAGNALARGGGLPLPPPALATKLLQPSIAAFEFRQLALATDDFAAARCLLKSALGDVFHARIEDSSGASAPRATLDVAVLRLPEYTQQGATEWKSEVQLLAQIAHPNVSAVKGYCAHEAGSRVSPRARRRQERLLVFAQPSNGSLHDHLFGSRSPLDWNTRVSIALGAARGLLYIHDRAPLQIAFKEFTASTVLLEHDFSPKLAGYGLSVTMPLVHRSSSLTTSMMLSQSQAKLNARSFGVVLLELVTGKNSRDAIYCGDDANFVHWGRQFTKESEARLAQIIDPRMKGGCPAKGALELVSLALRCVSKREAQRPSLSEVVGALKTIKAKYCCGKSVEARGRKPEGIRRLSHRIFMDVQTSSSDASSSENEDVGMLEKRSPVSMHDRRMLAYAGKSAEYVILQ